MYYEESNRRLNIIDRKIDEFANYFTTQKQLRSYTIFESSLRYAGSINKY